MLGHWLFNVWVEENRGLHKNMMHGGNLLFKKKSFGKFILWESVYFHCEIISGTDLRLVQRVFIIDPKIFIKNKNWVPVQDQC